MTIKEIDFSKYDVVSFDIFDTLLLRPYVKPTDLFYRIESEHDIFGFARKRILAEQKAIKNATKNGRQEITFDEIYSLLSEFGKAKELEISQEISDLTKNPETVSLLNDAKNNGKRIALTSDMYLPKTVIELILSKNGISNYDYLFLSSETGKRKSTGALYDHLILETGTPAHRILHIGDNEQSDIQIPTKKGVQTICYTPPLKKLLIEAPYISNFIKSERFWQASHFVGALAIGWQRYSMSLKSSCYWDLIGYLHAGPLTYAYTRWIHSQCRANNINDVLFVARDGYTPFRFWKKRYHDVSAHYVYAPRFTSYLIRKDFGSSGDEQIDRKRAILATMPISDIDEAIKKARDDYFSYYATLKIRSGKKAVADGVSASFSAQKLIATVDNDDVVGFCLANTGKDKEHKSFFDPRKHLFFCHYTEFLLSAPEGPVLHIVNGSPVHNSNLSKEEEFKLSIYPNISDAATSSCENFDKYGVEISEETLRLWFESFHKHPGEKDRLNLFNAQNATDSRHSVYTPVFEDWYVTPYVRIRRTISSVLIRLRIVSMSYELCGTQKVITYKLFGLLPFSRTIAPA